MSWKPKDRVMAVLSGEIPDRVPLFDYLIHDGILKYFGGKTIPIGDEEAMVRACSGCLDLCHPIGVPFEPGEKVLPDGTRRVFERWMSWDIPPANRSLETLAEEIGRQIEEREAFRPDSKKILDFKSHAREVNSWAGDMVYIHMSSGCAVLPGTIEEGVYLYEDYPDLVERWVKASNRALMLWVEAVADPADSPVAINWNDIALKGALMYPLPLLERHLFPALTELCDLYHSKGMKLLFHSDGDVTQALPSLTACGIDAFNPLEISAGMDPRTYKAGFGRHTTLVGGVDAVDLLAFADPMTVASETRRFLKEAGRNGRLIAASSSGEIDDSMPFDNVMAYFETVWEHGVY